MTPRSRQDGPCQRLRVLRQGVTRMVNALPDALPDATRVVFDDERVIANAGVLLPAVLAQRLGIEAVIDRTVDLGDRAGAANAGRKVMSLLSAMCLGADCIDDCSVLRSCHGPGPPAPALVRNDSLWMSIRSSVRSMAMTSRARAMGTPTRGGITRSSRPAREPGRCCTSARERARRTPPAVRSGSSRS